MSFVYESTEYSEEDSSDEEYSSSESDVSQDVNPWGETTKSKKGQGSSSGIPKERLRRKGKIPLNMTKNYGKKSGWGFRQGIRELIQNLYNLQ